MNLTEALQIMYAVENAEMFDDAGNATWRASIAKHSRLPGSDSIEALRLNFLLDNYLNQVKAQYFEHPDRPLTSEAVKHLIAIATEVFTAVHTIDPQRTLITDFDCAHSMFGSPWEYEAKTPEEFVFLHLSFMCDLDERLTDERAEDDIRRVAEIAAELNFKPMLTNPLRFFPTDCESDEPEFVHKLVQKVFEAA